MTQPPTKGRADYAFPDSTIKSSERLFELLKGEQDRLTNKVKIAEDRARGNNTLAIGAIGVLTLLRSLETNLPLLLVLLLAAGVIATLLLGLRIQWNRETSGITTDWMQEELQRLKNVDRNYLQIMQYYQRGWISNIADLDRLQRQKYNVLDKQNIALAFTLTILVLLLAWSGAGLK